LFSLFLVLPVSFALASFSFTSFTFASFTLDSFNFAFLKETA